MNLTFPTDKKITFHEEIKIYRIRGKNLVIVPELAKWFTTLEIETKILKFLLDGHTPRTAMWNCISNSNLERKETVKACTSLLTKLAKNYISAEAPDLVKQILPEKLFFQLYLTHQCNLRCSFCYMNGGEKLQNELSFDQWIRVIDETTMKHGPTNFTLSGGEPLLYKDFYPLANYIKSLGNTIMLLTNGTLIESQEEADNIAQLADHVQISIDGASSIGNDFIRGKGTFDRIVNSIQYFINSGKKIELSMMVTPYNIADYEVNLIKFLKSFNYNKIEIRMNHKILHSGRAKNLESKYFDFVNEAQLRVGILLNKLQEEGCFIPPFSTSNEFRILNCGIGGSLTIDSNGDIYPCAELYYKLGNYLNDELDTIYKKLEHILMTTSVTNMNKCQDCDLKLICKGGCRLENHRSTGSMCETQCDENQKNFILNELANVRQ